MLANSKVSCCFEGIAIRQDDILSIVSQTKGQSLHPECASCSIARSVVGNGGRRDFHVHAGKRRKTSLEESVSPTTLWSENFPNMEKTTSMRLWKGEPGNSNTPAAASSWAALAIQTEDPKCFAATSYLMFRRKSNHLANGNRLNWNRAEKRIAEYYKRDNDATRRLE